MLEAVTLFSKGVDLHAEKQKVLLEVKLQKQKMDNDVNSDNSFF